MTDNNPVLPYGQNGELIVPDPPIDLLLNFIADALTNPAVDVNKLEVLLRMQRQVRADDGQVQYIRAMAAAQAEIQPVARTAENTQTKSFYARLEDVDKAIRPIYLRHGFSLSFDEEPMEGPNMMIVCEVGHVGGHSKKYRLNAPPDTLGPKGTPVKTVLHGRGSTVTFLRRYLVCNIFNVVLRNQDDDGVRGGQRFMTVDQVAELQDLMDVTSSNLPMFLRRMGYTPDRAASLAEMESRDFERARNALLDKQRTMQNMASNENP